MQRSAPVSIFLGAGASISSGVPSAQMCIWEWKRNIFLTNNPGLEGHFSELSLPSIRDRIQQWLDKQEYFPANGAPGEYSFYIQKCFPIKDDRQAFFRERIKAARPHIGYQMLSQLAEADMIRSVWSTNFDGLPVRAAASFNLIPLEVGIDSQNRLPRILQKGELLCVSLHGDYRYDELKNTPEQLQTQDAALSKSLIEQTRVTPLIVAGYSGRDRSVMKTLEAAYAVSGSGALYWCGFGDQEPSENVVALIRHARSHDRQAYYVPTRGFDDQMIRVALHCLEGQHREAAQRRIASLVPNDSLDREPFQIPQLGTATLIKCNAFEIECPSEVFQFDLKVWPNRKVWSYLREIAGKRPLVSVPFRKVLALGTIEDIRNAFGDNVKGPIERTPINPDELKYEDGAIVSLMRQALVRSMAGQAGLETDGNRVLWSPKVFRKERQGAEYYFVHEAAEIYLRSIGGTQYLILMPTLRVFGEAGTEPSVEIAKAIKLKILSSQYNKRFNKAVNSWRKKLFSEESIQVFEFPRDCGAAFKFRVRRSPIFAAIGLPSGGPTSRPPKELPVSPRHHGLQLPEPRLVFSNKDGIDEVKDTHPIRGTLRNRPYDYPLTARGLSSSIRVGVVCPEAENGTLGRHLRGIERTHKPVPTERDYLPEYPGFGMAYGLPVELPAPDSPGWITCPDVALLEPVQGSRRVANLITQSIEQLRASYAPQVVLIFFPDRWQTFRGYRTEEGSFDVHDFVKAYCVQRGIATQFLNQDTLSYASQCRVWWWLSLALYVKGMRTPWLLDNLAQDTAFVGLGFSIDQGCGKW